MTTAKIIAFLGNMDIRYSEIQNKLKIIHEMYPNAAWISDGQPGTGLIVAKYAMLNRIPLLVCLPVPPEKISLNWLKGWRNILEETLKYAKDVHIISNLLFSWSFQNCYSYLINCGDVVVSFNTHSSGNIFDCIHAKTTGKEIIDGFSLSNSKLSELHLNYGIRESSLDQMSLTPAEIQVSEEKGGAF